MEMSVIASSVVRCEIRKISQDLDLILTESATDALLTMEKVGVNKYLKAHSI